MKTPIVDEAASAEVLLLTAHLESGLTPYAQTITLGHHAVACDEPVARGGADTGPTPFGLLLAALAGCTSITLRMYADRKGWDLGTVQVEVKLLRASDTNRIERTIRIGTALTPEQLTRLLEIAEKTPVTKALKTGLGIVTRLQ